MKTFIKEEIRPLMEELVKRDIFSPADVQGDFASNLNAVSKPQGNTIILGKADQNILRQQGINKNHQRLCIDLKGVNEVMLPEAKFTLPSYKTLVAQFSNCYCSQFDLTAMYWSIPLKYADQFKSNFWFDGRLWKMNRLIMGARNACYTGQRAALLTYSQENLLTFLKEKGLELKSEIFPFTNVTEFVLVYIDDICIWSSKNYKNSEKTHLLLLEFVLWCTTGDGF